MAAVEAVAVAGIVNVIEVPALLIDTAELDTETVPTLTVAPNRKVPVIVTVPTPRFAEADCATVMTVGSCGLTVIDLELSTPPAVVTTMLWLPSDAAVGTVTVTDVVVAPAEIAAARPSMVTVAFARFVPVNLTVNPRF